MSDMNVNQLLSQLRSTAELAKGETLGNSGPAENVDFSKLLGNAIDTVNEAQQDSGKLSDAFLSGDNRVNIGQVMIASQKAGIEFQLMLQVRNKLISAYQDIMNMQI